MNVSLICIWFIYEWTDPLPFSLHFFRPALSENWVTMTAVTSGSFWTAPHLNNTWESGCRTSYYTICAAAYAYLFPEIIGVYNLVWVLTLADIYSPVLGWWGLFLSVIGGWNMTIMGYFRWFLGLYMFYVCLVVDVEANFCIWYGWLLLCLFCCL